MKFILGTQKNKIVYDFQFHLLKSIEFFKFMNKETIEYIEEESDVIINEIEKYKDYIPVGSVEFFCQFCEKLIGKSPKPINIPNMFLEHQRQSLYNPRNVEILKDPIITSNKFVKDHTLFKGGFIELVKASQQDPIELKGTYLVSDIVNFVTEWRVFVFKNRIEGIKHYVGDFWTYPSQVFIERLVDTYCTESPIAYTLDIGVTDDGQTQLIEVHPFFSCGLYGFDRPDIMPFMLSQYYHLFIRDSKN